MKTKLIILLILLFSKSIYAQMFYNKDAKMGMEAWASKLAVEEIYVKDDKGNVLNNKVKFRDGMILTVYFSHIQKTVIIDGTSYIGVQVSLFDQNQKAIIESDDMLVGESFALTEYPDGPNPYVQLTVTNDLKVKVPYTLFIRIWDKYGEGHIVAVYRFTLVK